MLLDSINKSNDVREFGESTVSMFSPAVLSGAVTGCT